MLVHVAVVIVLLALPASAPVTPRVTPGLRKAVHLVAPRFFEPTQKAPNQGKVTRELDVRSAVTASRTRPPRFRPPAPTPPEPVPQASAAPPSLEPPQIEVPATAPLPFAGTVPQPALPDKPKLAFENVPALRATPNPNSPIPPPKVSVQEAVRSVIQPGGGSTVVEDVGDDFNKTRMQLMSDPKGVDFKPYLIQVLTVVRRNWMAVVPESARMGRRGLVLVQFIIDRRGAVPKLVIAEASGTEAFDRAAVAGISASYPFPPLPADYKGDQIRLQLAFSYNLPIR